MNPRHTFVLAAAVVLVTLGATGPVRAHDLKAKLDPDSDPIRLEAWFDDDTPARNARVTVTRSTGEEVASGTTDERGLWSFPKPGPGQYRVVVESIGHRDRLILTIPGGETPDAAPVAEGDERMNPTLGLGIGLTLLLGGSLAFLVLRSKRQLREKS